jgi:divalent metal cation (Fe/Co/Zn/Cd) transporter
MHLGPDAVLLAMKVKLRAHMPLEEVERTIDAVEAAIEAAAPEAKRIFIEPDSDYDITLDPERAGALPRRSPGREPA